MKIIWFGLFVLVLAQLGEDALRRFGVQEGDRQTLGALAGGLVDEADALCLGGSELSLDILASESHVVDTYTLVLDVLGDGRILRSGLQELNLGLTQHEECRANLLGSHLLEERFSILFFRSGQVQDLFIF